MTLLAASADGHGPFLVSDILYLQTTNVINHVPHAIYPIADVLTEDYWRNALNPTKKSYIINDHLCAGVAGNYFTAKEMTLELYDRFGRAETSLTELKQFLMGTNFGREPAVMVGLIVQEGQVEAFRYATSDRSFKTDRAFFEGTGGEPFKRNLLNPAKRVRVEIKRPGGWSPKRTSPGILHEIAEMLFLQHNAGHYLLDGFGGGFHVIEFHEGKFSFVDNYLMLPCYAQMDADGFDFSFDKSVVLQRFVGGRFTISTCPVEPIKQQQLLELELDWKKTSFNVAEDWLDMQEVMLSPTDIWDESVIDYYMIPIIWKSISNKKLLSSVITRRVASDHFTVKLLNRGDRSVICVGSNFEISIGNHYKDTKEIVADLEHTTVDQDSLGVSMMIRMDNTLFSRTSITLDGHQFDRCTFSECRLIYGGGPVEMNACSFRGDCEIDMVGPAMHTMKFIGSLLRPESGLQQLGFQLLGHFSGMQFSASASGPARPEPYPQQTELEAEQHDSEAEQGLDP